LPPLRTSSRLYMHTHVRPDDDVGTAARGRNASGMDDDEQDPQLRCLCSRRRSRRPHSTRRRCCPRAEPAVSRSPAMTVMLCQGKGVATAEALVRLLGPAASRSPASGRRGRSRSRRRPRADSRGGRNARARRRGRPAIKLLQSSGRATPSGSGRGNSRRASRSLLHPQEYAAATRLAAGSSEARARRPDRQRRPSRPHSWKTSPAVVRHDRRPLLLRRAKQ